MVALARQESGVPLVHVWGVGPELECPLEVVCDPLRRRPCARQGTATGRIALGQIRIERDRPVRRRHSPALGLIEVDAGIGVEDPELIHGGEARVGRRKTRILRDSPLKLGESTAQPFPRASVKQGASAQIRLVSSAVLGARHATDDRAHPDRAHERVGHVPRDLLLHREHIREVAVVPGGPDVCVGGGIDEIDRHPDTVAGVADRALNDVADAQSVCDLTESEMAAFQRLGRRSRDDLEAPDLRKLPDDLFGHAVTQVHIAGCPRQIGEREHRHGRDIRPWAGHLPRTPPGVPCRRESREGHDGTSNCQCPGGSPGSPPPRHLASRRFDGWQAARRAHRL